MNNDSKQILKELVGRYGVSIAQDPLRCEGMLRDRCSKCNREIFVLVNAIRQRVPSDLLSPRQSLPLALLKGFLKKRLQDELGFGDEIAQWAVETWAESLGISDIPAGAEKILPITGVEAPGISPARKPNDPDRQLQRERWADDLETGSVISRLDAVAGLSNTGNDEDIRILIGALENSQARVRVAAYDAIISKGSPAIPHLIEALADTRDGIVWRTVLILAALQAETAVQHLVDLLERPGKVRVCAIWALGEIGIDTASTSLMKFLNDQDRAIAGESAEALKKIGSG